MDLALCNDLVRSGLDAMYQDERDRLGTREVGKMCSPVICRKCGKWTWSGCGEHIEQALAGIKPDQLCQCK